MALFLTDDLLKSDKKRKKASEETVPALTSISERDNATTSLEQRLKDLEIVTNHHDIALRSLEAWSTTAFLYGPRYRTSTDTDQVPCLHTTRYGSRVDLTRWDRHVAFWKHWGNGYTPSFLQDGPFAK